MSATGKHRLVCRETQFNSLNPLLAMGLGSFLHILSRHFLIYEMEIVVPASPGDQNWTNGRQW